MEVNYKTETVSVDYMFKMYPAALRSFPHPRQFSVVVFSQSLACFLDVFSEYN